MTSSHNDTPSGPWHGGDLIRDLDWVQRLAFRLCSDRSLAEDLRQEAALAAFRQGAPAADRRRPWLAGIVRNKLRMRRRTETRRGAREASVARPEVVQTGVHVIERAETQQRVSDAVLRLREPYRTTVLQRYFDEWTPTEIAERTGTSIYTVKSRLKRGLRALEDDLVEVLGEASDGSDDGPRTGWYSALLPLAVMESNRRALASGAAGAQSLASVPFATAGWLLMIAKLSLVSLTLFGLFALFLMTRPPESTDASSAAALPGRAEAADGGLTRGATVGEPDGSSREALSVPLEAAAPPNAAAAAVCDLSGRVIDDRGRNLEGASVVLHREGGGSVVATAAGADGRFSLSVPDPLAPGLELRVEGEWFHASERLEFGGTGWRGRLPLSFGPRDVGTIVLGSAGAIAGRVVDSQGAPVAGATVTTLGGTTTTSVDDGSFRLERVSLGPDTLEVRSAGVPIAEADVTPQAGSVAGGVEVRLEPTVSLRGRVVDLLGQPVAGARVELDPVGRRDISRTKSDADGRFEVPFLWLEGAYLRVDAAGFDLWDSEEWDQEVSPDTAAFRVELQPSANVGFVVVDDPTGQPIERFGLQVHKGAGSAGMQVVGDAPPLLEERPGGRAVAGARNEYDRLVVVAEGYEPFDEDVLASGRNATGVATQTVRMQAREEPTSGSIRGRVLRDGAPLANAFVELVGGVPMSARMQQLSGRTEDGILAADGDEPLLRTGADGTFVLHGLEWPLYRVRVHAMGSATRQLAPVELERETTVDLGDIECTAGGTVRGQVLLPPGVSPRGLVASIGLGLGAVREPLDDGGAFELLHVPAGDHTVIITSREGDLDDGAEAEVTVADGEVATVVVEASGRGVVRVRLELDLGRAPADDCRVLFVDADDPETLVAIRFCDENGRLETDLPAAGNVGVCLIENPGEYVRHPSARLHLDAGSEVEETLRFRFAATRVAADTAPALPSDGTMAVELFDGEGVLHQRVVLEIEDGTVLDSPEAAYSPAPGRDGGFRLELHRALVGEWTVKVSVVALELDRAPTTATPLPEAWLEQHDVRVPAAGR